MKADYGLDAPGIVRGFAIAGAAFVAVAVALAVLGVPALAGPLWLAGAMFLLTVAAMLHSSRRGKLIERDRLLDRLGLRGDEDVLDVGCGRGLLLIGAAKRLPAGRAVGVDIWSQTDQSDNRRSTPTCAPCPSRGRAGPTARRARRAPRPARDERVRHRARGRGARGRRSVRAVVSHVPAGARPDGAPAGVAAPQIPSSRGYERRYWRLACCTFAT